jgi:predicted permease
MTMGLLLPAVSLILGLALAEHCAALKTGLAKLLSWLLIPAVIIYNMVYYQAGSIQLISFSFLSSAAIYALYRSCSRDQLQALCLAYPNLAWLGFPVAFALFGDAVSAAMVALYIGGSLFGNLMAVTALSPQAQRPGLRLRRVLASAPVLALGIAALLRVVGVQHLPQPAWLEGLYVGIKYATSFVGMLVLGMWLRHTPIHTQALLLAFRQALLRLLMGAVCCGLAWYFFAFAQYAHYLALMWMMFLLSP